MQKFITWLRLGFLLTLVVTQWQCASDSASAAEPMDIEELVASAQVDLSLVDDGLNCDTSIDRDCDGVWSDCDADDTDPWILIKNSCDADRDGYADEQCQTFADEDGDGLISEDERANYGFNCDVCPQAADADQTDSNSDGVGDLCSPVTATLVAKTMS